MHETRLKLNSNALAWSAEDGEVVALDLNQAHYLGVNRSGALLWELLAGGTSRSELTRLLKDEYGLGEDRAQADVDAFLRVCHDCGYLEE